MSENNKLTPCCCGSTGLKELKPYGIESVQCGDCHASLRKQDWNRVMRPLSKFYIKELESTLTRYRAALEQIAASRMADEDWAAQRAIEAMNPGTYPETSQ